MTNILTVIVTKGLCSSRGDNTGPLPKGTGVQNLEREADKTFRILVMLLELSGPSRGWALFIGHPWKKLFEVKMEHMLSLFSQNVLRSGRS